MPTNIIDKIKSKNIAASTLKLIAMITMTVDHIGFVLQKYSLFDYAYLLRIVGRIAFPIYCFLLVQGIYHTRSKTKYAIRLLVFALISDLPYATLFEGDGQIYYRFGCNVLWTLLMGLILICIVDRYFIQKPYSYGLILMIIFGLGAQLLRTDYGFIGIMLIYSFYVQSRDKQLYSALAPELTCVECSLITPMWLAAIASCSFTRKYNGEKGSPIAGKYFFYIYYPLHIAIIAFITMMT